RVRRCAEQHRRLMFGDLPQPCGRGHAAAGDAEHAESLGGFERGPKSKKWTEREREERTIAGADASTLVNHAPAIEQPFPVAPRLEPDERSAGGCAGGLVQTRVFGEWPREVGAVGRVLGLIGDEFGFGGEGEFGERRGSAAGELARVERALRNR